MIRYLSFGLLNKIRERMEFGRAGRSALFPSITARVTEFLRRSLVLIVILALNNPVSLPLLGLMNRIFGRPIYCLSATRPRQSPENSTAFTFCFR